MSTLAATKARLEVHVRPDVKDWLTAKAAQDCSTQAAIITALARAEMKRETQGAAS